MAIVPGICNSFKQDVLAMTPHTAADVYKIALYPSTANLSKATAAYSATGEVTGQGYTAGGVVLTGFSVTLDGDSGILDWSTDPTIPNSTITARGGLIYNSSRSNKAVAVIEFQNAGVPTDVTSTNGTFTITLPAPTAAAGLVRIG
ncbi:hypothetical protein [Noviherbaspirillum suwonense]|uniref:Bacteriophage protein n=1 Tax=Noviherbaspirillum suwonense TaxID=1224511 RepID=A0ABY1QIH1_9BURK|nr:hypothetical protein [Noviherbaspirillum suwonense]SMP71934.1 hypothetical protein SAMN06295970_11794 [Noviherbaspirillum suwonense]